MNKNRHKRAFENLFEVPTALVMPGIFLGSGVAKVVMGKDFGWIFIGLSIAFVLIFYFISYLVIKSRENKI